MYEQLSDLLAAVIATKQLERERKQGLCAQDHEMFSRALAGYNTTEQHIADFRRNHPTSRDYRSESDWKPNTGYVAPKRKSKAPEVKTKPTTSQGKAALQGIRDLL